MTDDSDSDSSVELKRVSSFKGHKVAPEELTLKIIVKPSVNSTRKKVGFVYTLKKGQPLPYSPTLEGETNDMNLFFMTSFKVVENIGYSLVITQDLKPEVSAGAGMLLDVEFKNDCWIFKGTSLNLKGIIINMLFIRTSS